MTTNGSLLLKKIDKLKEAGLNQVNISLDTLVESKNQFITRRTGGFSQTLKVFQVNFIKKQVRFIEFMPFDQNDWSKKKLLPYFEIRKQIENKYNLIRNVDQSTSTSKTFRIQGFKGTVGFISSMSDNFCGGCNRMRITADGNLKICLFDNREINLREMIDTGYSDQQILDEVENHLMKKHFSHGGVDSILQRENRSMIRIGG
ncbi:molybdenum cofactor biosynthesis protein a [Stylonychia lemnae]|uniref:Molybdenum cofactor biosynthesis protein a n=1 Tax=Stylonychia lemnae TaxID=5949 RepID=A0A078AMU6_STYLE|nr:molybdenum cofactor biosynthesis protein a [Stylonychia lemnae]|eukprot:CDW83479.1 molybdenum cofactor biosynthesis protein a [Stylonychia lemnae]